METLFQTISRRSMGRSSPFSIGSQFLICFFAGLLAGTILANLLYASLSHQAGYYLNLLNRRPGLGKAEKLSLFKTVCRQRTIEALFAWFMSLTAYAVPCFCLLCFFLGLSIGAVLSVMTGQMGLMGLPFFVASMIPQVFCYIPAVCFFLRRPARRAGKLKPAGILLVFSAVIAGSACEVWLNPRVLETVQSLLSVKP